MPLTNDEITDRVATILDAIPKQAIKPADRPLIEAGASLIINLLQNINDLAAKARGDI